ncbi:prephenate dehydrogenase [Ideonella livida]|uniref:Prephenate dehydrogenase/arogenate dehydrogenase family protein n=1 Tax=Ideonella livida TaxID=2707176 RepID=A0A7C9TGY6_9BURK|nr:prephenate dehydrogenase/arogenate dehydrogenase family protein [Ideonella livida]NDY90159.1 prephenate dehydrogenase/arogenate dehydrogenase family protein [Ideonella livida]
MFKQLGVIGCGLMGGSFALAMKQAGLVEKVIGYSKSPSTTERARQMGVIDQAAESALLAVSGADIVLLAVPVSATEATFRAIRHLVNPNVLFMDVGSTKRDVIDAARRVLKERCTTFVPAHPIAGKELAGVQYADSQLYRDRQIILTPIDQTAPHMVDKARALWTALGCQVTTMTPEAHDAAFAAVSHFPHLIAFAYFAGILQQQESDEFLALAGPGFRDFTRIAASDPAVWRDILIANREEVLRQSERFRGALGALEQALRECKGEALEALIRGVSMARSQWRMGAQPPRRG